MSSLDSLIKRIDIPTEYTDMISKISGLDPNILDIDAVYAYKLLGYMSQVVGSINMANASYSDKLISSVTENGVVNNSELAGLATPPTLMALNSIESILSKTSHKPYKTYRVGNRQIDPFVNEPARPYWFFVSFSGMPLGWSDPTREVYYVIKDYIEKNSLINTYITGNQVAYIDFIRNVLPLILTMKCRAVNVPSISVEDAELGNTYHNKIPFAGEKIDYGHTLRIEVLNDFSVQEVTDAIYNDLSIIGKASEGVNNAMTSINDMIRNASTDISKILNGNMIDYVTSELLGRITSRDILTMLSLSVVDYRGRHFFPYDYLIPSISIEYIYPKELFGGSYIKLRYETMRNAYVKTGHSEYSLSYNDSAGNTNITAEFGFQERDFGKVKQIPMSSNPIDRAKYIAQNSIGINSPI